MADDKLKWRVTPEQILETMRYFSAAELRTQQSKLSGAATQLEKLLGGRLSHLLTPDEAEIIRQAADLVRQLNTRVEHAKEIKNREEKRKEKARQLHQVAIDKALDKTLPAISRDATDIGARILSMTELLLALHAEKMTLTFMSKDELVADLRRKVDRYTARAPFAFAASMNRITSAAPIPRRPKAGSTSSSCRYASSKCICPMMKPAARPSASASSDSPCSIA